MKASQMTNQAFAEMLKQALEWVSQYSAEDIANTARVEFDTYDSCFIIDSLGQRLKVSYPDFTITPAVEAWHELLLLHYLHIADGSSLGREITSFSGLSGSASRGINFDREAEQKIAAFLDGKTPEEIKAALVEIGATFADSNADICAVIPLFSRFPLTLKIWLADEDFPASGKLFLSKNALHYLTVEDAVTAGDIILSKLND